MSPPPVPAAFEIITGARLHLGLLDAHEPFGGVGLMLRDPATRLRVRPAERFEAWGPGKERIEAVAKRFAHFHGVAQPPRCRIESVARPRPHTGLGSGTQLAMAAAEALCAFTGCSVDRVTLGVRIAGRGLRSAVGAHGYFQGGLIYEASPARGGGDSPSLNPVQCRLELCESWCVLLVEPERAAVEVAGETERCHFAELASPPPEVREQLRREVEEELLPAAAEEDFVRWSEAVYRYNRLSGSLFASVQGGPYNGAAIHACVDRLRGMGVAGVGQSSWGPTVFAFCRSRRYAEDLLRQWPDPEQVTISEPINHGRTLRPLSPPLTA